MSLEDDIAFLQRIPTFAILGEAALRILAIGSESGTLDAGEVLFEAGEGGDCGYVIQEGLMALRPAKPDDAEDVEIGPGTLLGELALLTETKRPASATALAPTVLMRIPRTLFRKILESFPDAALRLRDFMAARAEETAREFSRVGASLDPRFGAR